MKRGHEQEDPAEVGFMLCEFVILTDFEVLRCCA